MHRVFSRILFYVVRTVTELVIKSAVEKNVIWPRWVGMFLSEFFNYAPDVKVVPASTPERSESTAGTADRPRPEAYCGAVHCAVHREPQQGDG